MVTLKCRAPNCDRVQEFDDGTTFRGKPIEVWFKEDRDELCVKHYPQLGQQALFTYPALVHVKGVRGRTREEQFWDFHRANPWVYDAFVDLARTMRARGYKKLAIGLLFEILRWQYTMATVSEDGFKLGNNLRPRYARLIMEREPDLAGAFDTRRMWVP